MSKLFSIDRNKIETTTLFFISDREDGFSGLKMICHIFDIGSLRADFNPTQSIISRYGSSSFSPFSSVIVTAHGST